MKREMYYGKKYKTKDELIKAIEEYIDYYTNVVRQIKRGLILQIKTDFFNRLAMV